MVQCIWVAVICALVSACTRIEKPHGADSARQRDSIQQFPEAQRADAKTASPAPRPAIIGTTPPDTARGIVRRIGPDPVSRLALFPTAGAAPLALSGEQQSEVAAAEGLEVMVTGTRTTERAMDVAPGGAVVFRVQQFVVRAVDGVEAHDGVLRETGGQFVLEMSPTARTPIVDLPVALRTQVGARIFLVGPLTRTPQAFGVLRAK